jgi:hypothetical protein
MRTSAQNPSQALIALDEREERVDEILAVRWKGGKGVVGE